MIIIFISALILIAVFVKLGAMSVWVHVLSITLNAALVLIGGLLLAMLSIIWKQKKMKNE